jgi:hypothetical protein
MRLFLAPGVHAVEIADDLVFLDVAADAYFCLGGASEAIALGPDGQVDVGHEDMAAQLTDAGLLSEQSSPPSVALPPRPTASIRLEGTGQVPVCLGVGLAAVRVTLSVRRTFARSAFARLLEGPAANASCRAAPTQALVEAVAQFERLRPWLPLQGECLLRSYHLRTFLRSRGLDALWVFGVRTWPFSAHCWLQAGQTVLDEDLERLTAYHPILAA